jgi:hypothetical protein
MEIIKRVKTYLLTIEEGLLKHGERTAWNKDKKG